ncbi:Rieske (2Fe-2S) iron-sulfur domain-containing protein [Burkholderia sp. lig30]|jgi:3-phenylpropionate/trans-cinnamate dioxygenase ferredoxin subunit|uniref:Rieske (2Fe-2S) protein n=1 Tax=Burkholderia sp. lig30 TaxID=1192124 RepID=UPI0004615C74|nr:Rieske 2Fe-2S domain-containing protein [Burkholderia sp. lig30]KDB06452.1 Rieske (2Fe-2S) iron-sulfur domain-containing protein [Burkholderia sp. lig30]
MTHTIDVCAADELAPGQRALAFANGRSIVVFNIGGMLYGIDNSCPHQGASLASGPLDGTRLRCPAHGLTFDLTTGRMPGTSGLCVQRLPVRIVGGRVVAEWCAPATGG